MSVQNLMGIHPVVVEIFQSGPKWLADLLTDNAIPSATPLEIQSETPEP